MLKKPSLLWFLIVMIIVTPVSLLGYTDYRLSTFWVLLTSTWIYRQKKQVDSLFKVEGFTSIMDILIKNLYAWGLAYGLMAMLMYNIYDFVIFNDALVDSFDVWLRDTYHAIVAYLWMSLFMACIILYNVKENILFPIKGMVDKIAASVNNAGGVEPKAEHEETQNSEPHNEIEVLDASCSQMAHSIQQSLSVIKANKEKELKLENEINVAHKIQQGVLPNLDEVNEAIKDYGFSVQGGMNANESIGGDMFDCIKLDDDHLLISVADVSGEGVTAAVFMMMTQAMVYDNMDKGAANEIMARTNDFLATHNPNKLFVTMWLGIVELSTGKITYVSAGHNPPLLKDINTGKAEYLRDKSGLVLGLMPRRKYKVFERVLQPNSMLYLYTDGISEARDVNKDFFGEPRLQEAVETAQKPEDVLEKVHEFVGEAPQSDDMTYICLIRK